MPSSAAPHRAWPGRGSPNQATHRCCVGAGASNPRGCQSPVETRAVPRSAVQRRAAVCLAEQGAGAGESNPGQTIRPGGTHALRGIATACCAQPRRAGPSDAVDCPASYRGVSRARTSMPLATPPHVLAGPSKTPPGPSVPRSAPACRSAHCLAWLRVTPPRHERQEAISPCWPLVSFSSSASDLRRLPSNSAWRNAVACSWSSRCRSN